jgi:hypothetical protein
MRSTVKSGAMKRARASASRGYCPCRGGTLATRWPRASLTAASMNHPACQVTSRGRPALTGRRRSITFSNDHHPTLEHATDAGRTFPFDLRKRRIISMYERPANYSGSMWLDPGDFVRRCAAILSPPCHQGEGQGSPAFAASPFAVKATTAFTSAAELAATLRRAAVAHREHQKRTGGHDANWPDWYTGYIVREQEVGEPLPS